jgi:hypothetical protein
MQMLLRCLPLALTAAVGCEPAANFGALTGTENAPPSSTVEVTDADGIATGSVGYVTLVPDMDQAIGALHVRVAIGGQARAVTADGANARLETPVGSVRPIAINASSATLPIVVAEPGGREIVDFYFASPESGTLRFAWTASTVRGPLAIRAAVQPGVDAGQGPRLTLGAAKGWWFAPTYAWATYRHEDGIVTTHPPTAATVHGADDKEPVTAGCNEW